VDADLSGYFDSIPHTELMKSVARRLSDRHILHLIKMWLQMPVEETDERGHTQRTTRNKDEHRGTPQGSPISPLLSNLYMRRFVLGWRSLGHAKRLKAEIVNYADDCAPGEGVHEMRVGPSQPVCGGRLQTTLSGGGQEPRVVSVKEKAWLDRVR